MNLTVYLKKKEDIYTHIHMYMCEHKRKYLYVYSYLLCVSCVVVVGGVIGHY